MISNILSQLRPSCCRILTISNKIITQEGQLRQISLSASYLAAKPAVNIGSLGKAAGKKKLGKLGPAAEKLVLPTESDTQRLHDYVCGSNMLKEGGEDIKLQPDSEYPDWLWEMRTGKFPELSEMDPESKEYWLKVRRMARWHNNKLMKLKRL